MVHPETIDWRAVFAASPAPACVVGAGGVILAANPAFAALAGAEAAMLSGQPLDAWLTLDGSRWAVGAPEPPMGGPAEERRGVAFLAAGEGRAIPYSLTALPAGGGLLSLSDAADEHCFICKVFSSRDKFRTAIDDQSEVIVRVAPDLSVTLVNREFAALFGVPPRALIGRGLHDLMPPDSATATAALAARATPDEPASAAEESWPCRDGRERWFSWRRYAVFDGAGRLTAVQAVGRDTTRRRLAEQERRRLEAMIARSPVIGLGWRSGGRMAIDHATENISRLGLDRRALLDSGAGLLDLVHPEDAAALRGWAAACPPAQAGDAAPFPSLSFRLPGAGGERWLTLNGWCAGPGRMEGVLLDITERRDAALALRERERRFQAIINSAADFVGLLTPDGVLIEANEAALRFIQADATAVCGRPFWETPWWIGCPEQPLLREGIVRAASGDSLRFETTHASPDGVVIHLDCSLRPMRDAADAIAFLVVEGREITRFKMTEAELVAARRLAEAANRSKTQFLAVMSHELRTPLNAVLGYSEVMQRGLFGPVGNERYAGYVDAIHSAGRHLLDIIDDILEISRIELGVVDLVEEIVTVADLLDRSVRLLATRAAEAGVALTLEAAPGLPPLRCDARRVVQILVNLGVNAIKFTPPGGCVRLEARPASAAEEAEGGLLLAVRDTGSGIAASDLQKVWEPFGQAGNAHVSGAGGVGLGLAITKALVEAHGGTAWLDSAPGHGTTVTLRFPAERCAAG
ncbi:PAS domain S-box-containing protein [Azospirillum agricola]|uniref:sensor histidine kinase n=1 Tax=Azospirillum agricola TaxID=1720247 RepID=UPI001AE360A0|nr:PAS domain-containing protein [Azospirillum agricola]MBP2231392.1 PAS domain S-box-containing protein [Azospirillum agricola]